MKWYENNILIGILALTSIAFGAMTLIKPDSKEIVMNIITGIAAFVTGYVAHGLKDATTTISRTTTEQTSNADGKIPDDKK